MAEERTAGDGCVVVWRARLDIERVEVHTCGDTSGGRGPDEAVWSSNYISVTGQSPFDILTQMRDHVLNLVRRAGADLVDADTEEAPQPVINVVGVGGVTQWTPERGACLRDETGHTIAVYNGASWVDANGPMDAMPGVEGR